MFNKNKLYNFSKHSFILISFFIVFILLIPATSFAMGKDSDEPSEPIASNYQENNLFNNTVVQQQNINKLGEESNYLCLKPHNAGQSTKIGMLKFKVDSSVEYERDLNYSFDLSTWIPIEFSETANGNGQSIASWSLLIDKPIYFRGDNPGGLNIGRYNSEAYEMEYGFNFDLNYEEIDASGSIMSLVYNGDSSINAIPSDYCFIYLFNSCTKLITSPSLPSISLKKACYSGMFCMCESIKNAPKLPALTLTEGCYSNMFLGCSSLTIPPSLDASIMQPNCYLSMFWASGIIKSPTLNSVNLASHCYMSMFKYCKNLKTIDVGFSDWYKPETVDDATFNWVSGVPTDSLSEFYCSSDLDIKRGDSYIPLNWRIITDKNVNAVVESYTGEYDNNIHSVKVESKYPADAIVLYSLDGDNYTETPIEKKDVGCTPVYVRIEHDGWRPYETCTFINITPKTGASATIASKWKYYGQEDPDFDVSFDGILGDTPVLGTDYILEREKGEDVKPNDATYEVKLYWIRDNNYNLTVTNGTLKIKKANDLKLVANPESKSSSQEDPTFTAHMEGLKFNDALGPNDYEIKKTLTENSSDTYTLTPELTPSGKQNFSANYDITVTDFAQPAIFTVYSEGETKSIKYKANGINIDYDAQEHEFKVTNVEPSTAVVQYSKNQSDWQTDTFKFTNAEGPTTVYYKITADDYPDVFGNETVTINKAHATLVADANNLFKNKGEADPDLSATLMGAVKSEVFEKDTDYSISRVAGEDPGTYDINLSKIDTDKTKNYAIDIAEAKFCILGSASDINYEVNSYDAEYDGWWHEFSISVSLPNSDVKISYSMDQKNWQDDTFWFKNAGFYTVYYKIYADNYGELTGNGDLIIHRAKASLVLDSDKNYKTEGNPDPDFSATLYGAAFFDDVIKNKDYTVSRQEGEDAGVYDVNLNIIASSWINWNYEITVVPAKFFILANGIVPPGPGPEPQPQPSPDPPSPDPSPDIPGGGNAQTGDGTGFACAVFAILALFGACGFAFNSRVKQRRRCK